MKKSSRTWQSIGFSTLLLLASAVAQADSFSQLTTPSLTFTDAATWAMINGSALATQTQFGNNSTSFSTSGDEITISVSDSANMEFVQPGAGWQAGGGGPNYPANQNIIATLQPTSTEVTNGVVMTLTFANPIEAFGVYIQDNDYTTYDSTFGVNGTSNTYTADSTSDGNIEFLGIEDLTTNGIHSVSFTVPYSGTGAAPGNGDPDWFAIGEAVLIDNGTVTSSVPEPGSLMLMAGGIAALALKLRKRAA